jgi:hypothetical protein
LAHDDEALLDLQKDDAAQQNPVAGIAQRSLVLLHMLETERLAAG